MRDFPSCFGESGVQVAHSSSSSSSATKSAQNLVTCVYQCKLHGRCLLITVTWSKGLMGQGLGIAIDDSNNQCLCKIDIKSSLFFKRKGCKNLVADSDKVDVSWDLSNAKFGSGPEPMEGFYLAVALNQEMLLVVGDMKREAFKKIDCASVYSNANFVAKREHIFGKKFFVVKAQLSDNGQIHDIVIECDTIDLKDPCLVIRVDSKMVMQVKRLKWKFRGNHGILVDGIPVEVFWDVHNWLFGNCMGNAVFMFQTCLPAEKLWSSQSIFDPSILNWSYSQRFSDCQLQGGTYVTLFGAHKDQLSLILNKDG